MNPLVTSPGSGRGKEFHSFPGFTALPAPIVASIGHDLQVVLEMQALRQVTADDVRRDYQRLPSKYRPDRAGGDAERLAELNQARDDALKQIS